MARLSGLVGYGHQLETLNQTIQVHIQVVLKKYHYPEVHHVQDLAKTYEIGCQNVFQNLQIDKTNKMDRDKT